jgi:hypothetical protein
MTQVAIKNVWQDTLTKSLVGCEIVMRGSLIERFTNGPRSS